jgi:hypothetical protein
MNPEDEFVINLDSETITIDLSKTYGATTTYAVCDSMNSITISDGHYAVTSAASDWNININDIIWSPTDNSIDTEEVERMCKEYPGLEKVWNNFKAVYDMVKQDYEGKKQAGELDE